MTHRKDIAELSFQERFDLASIINMFLNQNVIDFHMRVDHMNRFFTHHRAYLFGLEQFIKDNITDFNFVAKVVPLPVWDPRMTLPSSFDTFEGRSAVAPNSPPPQPPPNWPPVPMPPNPLDFASDPVGLFNATQAYTGANNSFIAWNKLVDISSNTELAVGQNQDRRLEIFYGGLGLVFHKWQVAPVVIG